MSGAIHPLFYALKITGVESMKVLIEHGADVNLRNEVGIDVSL